MYISSVESGKAKSVFFYFHTVGGPFCHSDLVTYARAFQLLVDCPTQLICTWVFIYVP